MAVTVRLSIGSRGTALVVALAAMVLVSSLAAAGLAAAAARIRLAAADRWSDESRLVVASVLAMASVTERPALADLADGETRSVAAGTWSDGWVFDVDASRSGALIRLVARVRRGDTVAGPVAARRATLLLVRGPSDTVRVLRHYARF